MGLVGPSVQRCLNRWKSVPHCSTTFTCSLVVGCVRLVRGARASSAVLSSPLPKAFSFQNSTCAVRSAILASLSFFAMTLFAWCFRLAVLTFVRLPLAELPSSTTIGDSCLLRFRELTGATSKCLSAEKGEDVAAEMTTPTLLRPEVVVFVCGVASVVKLSIGHAAEVFVFAV